MEKLAIDFSRLARANVVLHSRRLLSDKGQVEILCLEASDVKDYKSIDSVERCEHKANKNDERNLSIVFYNNGAGQVQLEVTESTQEISTLIEEAQNKRIEKLKQLKGLIV